MKTKGNTILVTGAANGIGLAISKLFAENDNKIIMVDIASEKLKSESAGIKGSTAINANLTSEEDINNLIQTIKLEHKDLSIVILNAGAANSYSLFSREFDLEFAVSEINTNYIANVRLTHLLEPLLEGKKNPAFVVTTSGLAFVPNLLYPTYSVTKAALHSFAIASRLALQKKGSNIKFFDLMPPLTDTRLAKVMDAPKMSTDEVASWLMKSMEKDEFEIHVGDTEKVYKMYLESPEKALLAVNPG